MRASALICAIASSLLVAPAMARQESAQAVAAALQTRYDRIRDLSADFTQQYESGVLKRKITERGKLQV